MEGDLTSASETGTNINDRWKLIDSPYVEFVLIFLSDLIAIIEMNIRKNLLPRQVTADWSAEKNIKWSLVLGKIAGSHCNPLLVGCDHASYPA